MYQCIMQRTTTFHAGEEVAAGERRSSGRSGNLSNQLAPSPSAQLSDSSVNIKPSASFTCDPPLHPVVVNAHWRLPSAALEPNFLDHPPYTAAAAMYEARLTQGNLLKKIVDAIKDLVTEANFDVNSTGFGLQAMDNSHVSLVALQLRADGFEHYRCDRSMSMGKQRCTELRSPLTLRDCYP
jgi:hypothetical protein